MQGMTETRAAEYEELYWKQLPIGGVYVVGSVTRTITYDVRFCRFCMGSIVFPGSRLFPGGWTADSWRTWQKVPFFFPFPFLINWASSMELNGISMSKSDLLGRMFSMFSPTPLTILVGRLNYSSDYIILSRSIFDNPFQTKKAPANKWSLVGSHGHRLGADEGGGYKRVGSQNRSR